MDTFEGTEQIQQRSIFRAISGWLTGWLRLPSQERRGLILSSTDALVGG